MQGWEQPACRSLAHLRSLFPVSEGQLWPQPALCAPGSLARPHGLQMKQRLFHPHFWTAPREARAAPRHPLPSREHLSPQPPPPHGTATAQLPLPTSGRICRSLSLPTQLLSPPQAPNGPFYATAGPGASGRGSAAGPGLWAGLSRPAPQPMAQHSPGSAGTAREQLIKN